MTFYFSPNYKTWRNVLLTGAAGFLEGVLRLVTLGFVSSSLEMTVICWVSARDSKKRMTPE